MKKVRIETKSELILKNIGGFYKRRVTTFGNSAKVDCPKEHIGKEVYLVILKK